MEKIISRHNESTPDGQKIERLSQLAEAWGDYLRGFEPDFAATFTFTRDVGSDLALAEFGKLVQDLGRRSGAAVWAFGIVELTYLGRVHVHALIRAEGLSLPDIEESWEWKNRERRLPPRPRGYDLYDTEVRVRAGRKEIDLERRRARARPIRGRSLVEDYDPSLGWARYISTGIGGLALDYGFFGTREPRRGFVRTTTKRAA